MAKDNAVRIAIKTTSFSCREFVGICSLKSSVAPGENLFNDVLAGYEVDIIVHPPIGGFGTSPATTIVPQKRF